MDDKTRAEFEKKIRESDRPEALHLDSAFFGWQAAKELYAPREVELEDILNRISQWCEAYPVGVFPEPDFKKAAEALSQVGITLDSVSASNMRHVLNGIAKLIATKEPQ